MAFGHTTSGVGPIELRAGVLAFVARVLGLAAASAAVVAVVLAVAVALPPVSNVAIQPAAVSSDGGHAYRTAPSFGVRWLYVIPSHPDDDLRPGDVRVIEDGAPIGRIQPSHDAIRADGGGGFNLWDKGLWFSASDGTDPRTNGRTYRVEVRTRPSAALVAARNWSLVALTALVLARLGIVVLPGTIRAGRSVLRTGTATIQIVHDAGARIVAWTHLSFGRFYALVSALSLTAFVWGTLARPAPLFTQPDSFGYIIPGLIWASGHDVTGQSIRDIGYPMLTLLAVRLGSLTMLPRIQIVLVAAGIVCLLASLFVPLPAVALRLERAGAVPRWLSTAAAAGLAAAFVSLLASHDLFVIDIESAMAEAPHVLPTAAAVLLLLVGWTGRPGSRRIAFLIAASLAAYMSAMVKPHTLLVVPLCLASVVWAGIRSPRALRSPSVVIVGLCAAALAFGVHRLEAWVTPKGTDFGPKILFCNHLDVIEPVFDRSNPERVRVAAMMRDTLSRVDGWPLLGFAGDGCIYNEAFKHAIESAARAEGESPARWQLRQFLLGVARNPLRYGQDALRQAVYYMLHPIANIEMSAHSDLPDAIAGVLRPYASLINMPRDAWDVDASNWVPAAHPLLSGPAKRALQTISDLFAPVTLLATLLATVAVIAFRKGRDACPEVAVIATACFTGCFAATVILTHSFDVGRYVTDLLPISLLWWFLSAVYLAHLAILAAAWLLRRLPGGPAASAEPRPGAASLALSTSRPFSSTDMPDRSPRPRLQDAKGDP